MNGAWYFSTREGERGPFASPERAQQELDRYVFETEQLRGFQNERQANARKEAIRLRTRQQAELELVAEPRQELTLEAL